MTLRKLFAKRFLTLTIPVWWVLVFYSLAFGQWTSVSPPALSSTDWLLYGVDFPSATEGWAVGSDNTNEKGALLRYLNGHWEAIDLIAPQNVGQSWLLSGVNFTSTDEGWAVGQKGFLGVLTQGVLLHYTNGTWSYDSSLPAFSSNWWLWKTHFTSADEGWAVGGDGNRSTGALLHYSKFGGDTPRWDYVVPPDLGNMMWALFGVHFTSQNEGWAVGGVVLTPNVDNRGVLLHYSNNQWVSVDPPEVSDDWGLWGVHFPSPNRGWAVGVDYANGRGVLLRYQKCQFSPCPPQEWESILPPENVSKLFGVYFTSEDEGWVVGVDNVNGRGVLLHYLDSTWTSVDPPSVSTNWNLWDVHFTSPDQGWAVGSEGVAGKGVLLRYESSIFQLKSILKFFDDSVTNNTLIGFGPGKSADGRLKALRNMIVSAGNLIENEDYPNACRQLMDAYLRTDGKSNPPDFAVGSAGAELTTKIDGLMESMGCN